MAAVCCRAERRARGMRWWCSGQRTLAVIESGTSREIGTVLNPSSSSKMAFGGVRPESSAFPDATAVLRSVTE